MSTVVHSAQRVASLFGFSYTLRELRGFGKMPFPYDNYLTFFDPGLSIKRMREIVSDKPVFFLQDWYDDETFAKTEATPSYRRLRMEALADSFNRKFFVQKKLLFPGEMPLARVVAAGMVIHFLVSSKRLLPSHYVRCADQTKRGRDVIVGLFGQNGMFLNGQWHCEPSKDVGVTGAN